MFRVPRKTPQISTNHRPLSRPFTMPYCSTSKQARSINHVHRRPSPSCALSGNTHTPETFPPFEGCLGTTDKISYPDSYAQLLLRPFLQPPIRLLDPVGRRLIFPRYCGLDMLPRGLSLPSVKAIGPLPCHSPCPSSDNCVPLGVTRTHICFRGIKRG